MNMDYPISSLRVVVLIFKGQHRTTHMCHFSQTDALVQASIRLHGPGGGNPHTGKCLDNLWEIRVEQLNLTTDSYWWCSPTLSNGDINAAQLNQPDMSLPCRVWAHPDLLEDERKAEDWEDIYD